MKPRIWLASLAAVAGLMFTLAFAPVTMAQELADAPNVTLQQGQGNRHGGNGNPDAGSGNETCDGSNFVDADGDGVCDNIGTGAGNGSGSKQQQRGNW